MAEVGRPLKFKTVKVLEDKIQEYFDSCFKEEWFEEFRRDEETGHWIIEEVRYSCPWHLHQSTPY